MGQNISTSYRKQVFAWGVYLRNTQILLSFFNVLILHENTFALVFMQMTGTQFFFGRGVRHLLPIVTVLAVIPDTCPTPMSRILITDVV